MIVAQAPPPSSPAATAAPKTPAEFFARARQLSDLEAAGIPFHVKATYVASGNAEFTGNGTYEEWWESKDSWRKEATLGDFRWFELQSGAEPATYTSSPYVPFRLRQAIRAVLIGTEPKSSTNLKWQVKRTSLGGVKLIVVSAKRPIGFLGPQRTAINDYFTSEGLLRIQQASGTLTLYNHWQRYQNLFIPRSIQVMIGTTRVLDISINTLEPLSPSGEAILPSVPAGLNPAESYAAGPGFVAPQIVRRPVPDYPTGLTGGEKPTVFVGATIDEQGRIREPFIEQSAGSTLDREALAAFSRFQFRPATKGGRPVAVQITVPLVFANQSSPVPE